MLITKTDNKSQVSWESLSEPSILNIFTKNVWKIARAWGVTFIYQVSSIPTS